MELSLEKKFAVRSFCSEVDAMTEAQAKALLKKTYEQMQIREVYFTNLIGVKWGMIDEVALPDHQG